MSVMAAQLESMHLAMEAQRVHHQQQQDEQRMVIDLVMLGRPALANPHWPVWAARELGHAAPFSLVQEDWRWWLDNFRGHPPSIGWPAAAPSVETGPPD